MKAYADCKCTFAQHMTGDGCDECNPEYATEHSTKPTLMNELPKQQNQDPRTYTFCPECWKDKPQRRMEGFEKYKTKSTEGDIVSITFTCPSCNHEWTE